MCLRKRLPSSYSYYGALFKPVFTGTLKPHGESTLIEGEFAQHGFGRGFVKVFCWGIFSFFTLMILLVLIRMLMGTAQPGAWWALVVAPLVIGAGHGYGRLVKQSAQGDIGFCTYFVRETANTTPATPERASPP